LTSPVNRCSAWRGAHHPAALAALVCG
jgi:hypothetical protein